jgi:hypothetical protein
MDIQYTPKFLKLMSKIKHSRGKEETEKVISKIQNAKDFSELNTILDIKKYVVGGYRIRYSGKPEMRIRFSLLSNPLDETKKIIELRFVGTREDYEKIAHKPMNESKRGKRVIVISDSQFKRLILK